MRSDTQVAVERVHPPRWLITHVVNPVARKVLRGNRRMGDQVLLLRFIGRRTGHAYEIPVSYRRIEGRMALLTNSRWRHNFRGGAEVEVILKGEVRPMYAELTDDPLQVAKLYQGFIQEVGIPEAQRRLGIKIHVDRPPTVEELTRMAARCGLSVVWLEPRGPE